MKHAYTARNDGAGWTYTLRISVSKFPLGEGGRPKAGGWIRLEEAGAAKQLKELKSPAFPTTRKISRLLEAVAVLDCIFMKHAYTARNDGAGWTYTLRIPVSKFPLEEGGRPKAGGWIRLEEAGAAKQLKELKSPVFPSTRKILGLIAAVAILDCILMKHASPRVVSAGEGIKVRIVHERVEKSPGRMILTELWRKIRDEALRMPCILTDSGYFHLVSIQFHYFIDFIKNI